MLVADVQRALSALDGEHEFDWPDPQSEVAIIDASATRLNLGTLWSIAGKAPRRTFGRTGKSRVMNE
jgi:hypothetical protein